MTFKSNTLSYFSWIFVAVCLASAGVIGLLQSHATLLSLLAIVLAFVASIAAMNQFRQQQDEIQAFIGALTYQDFTLRISDSASLAPRYQKACNNILKRMQREKNRQEERLLLMENLMQALESGIILVRNEQDVLLCNNAAKKQLNISSVSSMQALLADHPELDIVEREPQFYQDLQMQYFTFSLHHNRYAFWIITSVSEAIEEAQIDSWQKLIRILIHEISNSVAPVHSLADTLADLCQQQSQKQAHQDEEFYTDVRDGLRVISQRSEGLLGFVEEYRKLVHIPSVNTDVVSLKKTFDAMKTLFEQEFNEANIKLETQLSSADLVIKADEKLFEQVLINLLINAKHAIERAGHQQGKITLSASINRYSKTQIKVTDNGTGIAKSALEKIFVPFFTTKSDGSGIGLSLCKQIIHKHKGALQVSSVEGEGSEFRIIL